MNQIATDQLYEPWSMSCWTTQNGDRIIANFGTESVVVIVVGGETTTYTYDEWAAKRESEPEMYAPVKREYPNPSGEKPTVAWLKKELEKFPDEATVYAYEGECTGLIIERTNDQQRRQGVIHLHEDAKYNYETELLE